ncbi:MULTISPECIES: YibE/F family protein [unclassified Clostridium]|uniref:YibE/F family protein n=1 Tax=unclassified Clostridium TaxID=2614128 RepID=UPI000297D871|nr:MULTISPECIES: YibE/F family protein [unclassified Clostridium]EKQ57196.1 MAG: YibE/F-like protein [Clostridium sp. Maddingley MBC34-26]
MNIIFILLIILLILMTIVGGSRGIKSYFTLILNFFTLFFMLILIGAKIDPIKVTFIGALFISFFSLFFINGFNKKTLSSLFSVIIVIFLVMLITYSMSINAKIQGFSNEQTETVAYLSLYVQLNFSKIVICEILIGLLGAIIDVSISISSSMNEIYKNDPQISKNSLFKSGMNIGKDILGTMTNTLLFAYISGFMTLIIYYSELNYSLSTIFNQKIFCSEVFQIISCGIGIIFIIPITAFLASRILFFKLQLKKQIAE